MKLRIFSIFFILFTWIYTIGFSQEEPVKWSVNAAQSFIKRFPDPDTMYCCGNTNHFSWQAGYVMFAMEKIWKAYAGMVKKAKTIDQGFIDLIDCSSIGIQNSTEDYFNSPKEVSPFGAFGSFIISTTCLEFK